MRHQLDVWRLCGGGGRFSFQYGPVVPGHFFMGVGRGASTMTVLRCRRVSMTRLGCSLYQTLRHKVLSLIEGPRKASKTGAA